MVSATYTDTQTWARMAIHNIASSGKFSSDRYLFWIRIRLLLVAWIRI